MSEQIQTLNPKDITSDVYIIAPTQIEYISRLFGNTVADTMNMRTFAPKIRQIAEQALRHALTSAKTQGVKQAKKYIPTRNLRDLFLYYKYLQTKSPRLGGFVFLP